MLATVFEIYHCLLTRSWMQFEDRVVPTVGRRNCFDKERERKRVKLLCTAKGKFHVACQVSKAGGKRWRGIVAAMAITLKRGEGGVASGSGCCDDVVL